MESEVPDTPDVGDLLAAEPVPEGSEQRVERIIDRSRQELATRDLITFSLVRVWKAVPLLATALVSLLIPKARRKRG